MIPLHCFYPVGLGFGVWGAGGKKAFGKGVGQCRVPGQALVCAAERFGDTLCLGSLPAGGPRSPTHPQHVATHVLPQQGAQMRPPPPGSCQARRPQRKAQQSPPLPHGRGAGRGVQGGGIPDRGARPGPLPALEPERVPDVPVEVAPPPSQPSVVPRRVLSSCSARRCFLGKRALRWASGQLPPSECREPREHLPVLGGRAINNEKEKGV